MKRQRTSRSRDQMTLGSTPDSDETAAKPHISNQTRVNALSRLLARDKDGSTSGDLVGGDNEVADVNLMEASIKGTLFVNGVSGADVIQGKGTKDCYFLSALASLAQQDPTYIEDMIVDQGNGSFAVRFFTVTRESTSEANFSMEPHWVSVTESFEITADGTPAYGRSDNMTADGQRELWVTVVEKAFTVLDANPMHVPNWSADQLGNDTVMSETRGGYEGIWSGFSQYAMLALLGDSEVNRDISDDGGGADEEWQSLVDALDAGKIVSVDNVSINIGFGWDYDGDAAPAHAVSVFGYSLDGPQRTVIVYDQMGGETSAERLEYMDFDDFLKKFETIHIGTIPTNAPTAPPTNAAAGANRIDMARLALEAAGITAPTWDADVGRTAIAEGIMAKKTVTATATDAEVISGLKLNDAVNRGEAAKMLVIAAGVNTELTDGGVAYFYDVPQSQWYYNWIHIARMYGILKGDKDVNRARPAATLSTTEIAFLRSYLPLSTTPVALADQANGGPIITDPDEAQSIDIDVPFIYQRENNSEFGFTGGDLQCFVASKAMVENTTTPDGDVTVTDGTPANNYFTGDGQDTDGNMEADGEMAEAAIAYLDTELEAGRPVVVGVTYMVSAHESYNVDGITDHFMVVKGRTGSGDSAQYAFLDPWSPTEEAAEGEFTRNSEGNLSYDTDDKGSKLNGHYEVTMVRKNTT